MMNRRFRHALVPLAIAGLLGACHSWRPQTTPAPQVVEQMNGRGTVRIVRADQSVMVLANPQVVGDSIVGTTGDPPQHAAVAVADVRRIDTRRVSATRTGGVALGTVAIITIVAVGAALAAVLGGWN